MTATVFTPLAASMSAAAAISTYGWGSIEKKYGSFMSTSFIERAVGASTG